VTALLDDLPNLVLKQWYFVDDNIPDNVIVYTKVMMYQPVSHAGDGVPSEWPFRKANGSPFDVVILTP